MNDDTFSTVDSALVLGALVADAAALGLHWLYEPSRIAQIEGTHGLVFLAPEEQNYQGAKGYFAHGEKEAGQSSSYGEVCLLMLRHLSKHKGFKRVLYQGEYLEYFGPGGSYVGYVDAPTKKTLHTLMLLSADEFPENSGADDDQMPALAAVPPLVAHHLTDKEALLAQVAQVVRLTNDNDVAVAAAQYASAALWEVANGKAVRDALCAPLSCLPSSLAAAVTQAMETTQLDSVAIAEKFGSACHVPQGLPVIAHIAHHATSYRDAICANIRAGGDSCGRAIFLGALVAADAARRGEHCGGIPLPWLTRATNAKLAVEVLAGSA